tara:strand:+ start:472 stop:1089 length:618 start_codon:yes stop_codon:yes gene_type:complete
MSVHTSNSAQALKISLLEEQVANAQTLLQQQDGIKRAQRKHSDHIAKEWITTKLEKEINRLEDEKDIIEIDFKRLNVEVTEEFGPQDSGALRHCSPGEVVPDFVNLLFNCERERDEGGDNEEFFFHTDGEMWFVADVCLTGKGHKFSAAYASDKSRSQLKWMYLSVKFEKIEHQECCISGDSYPVSQMVTNGDDWMYKGVWEAFE